MSLKTWEINGVSLKLDLEDADVMERYEDAFEAMSQEEKHLPKDGRPSDRIRAYCNLFRKLYDRIFGTGTADKIFMDLPTNAEIYDGVYDQFLNFVRKQNEEVTKRRASRLDKYRPNRQQRRAVKRSS